MQQVICKCAVWDVEFERTTDRQPAWELRCPDCGQHIIGLEKEEFQKITVSRADLKEVQESANPFFRRRTFCPR